MGSGGARESDTMAVSRRVAGGGESTSTHPCERGPSGLNVVARALVFVHARVAGGSGCPRVECEPVAGMDNADAFDCQGSLWLRTKPRSGTMLSGSASTLPALTVECLFPVAGLPAPRSRGGRQSREAGGTGSSVMRRLAGPGPVASAKRSCRRVPGSCRGSPWPPGLAARNDGSRNIRLRRGRSGSGRERRRGAHRRDGTSLRRADRGGARRPVALAQDSPWHRDRPDRRTRSAALLDRGRAQASSRAGCTGREERVLGGSSTINGMLWVRGDPAVYDGWADLGCAVLGL